MKYRFVAYAVALLALMIVRGPVSPWIYIVNPLAILYCAFRITGG